MAWSNPLSRLFANTVRAGKPQQEPEDPEPRRETEDPSWGSFCVIPWKHLHICDTGLVRLCCASSWLTDSKGQPLTVYESSIDDLWNSDHMRRVRRAMVLGGDIPECTSCWNVEADGGVSRRMQQNTGWEWGWVSMEGTSIDQLKRDAIADDFSVRHRPFDLGIETGNSCNLKCRICSINHSSRIEQDPVHSRWQGRPFEPLRWRNDVAVFGATPVLGAVYEGFWPHNRHMHMGTRWTNGNARLKLPPLNSALDGLKVFFSSQSPLEQEVTVTVNDTAHYSGCPAASNYVVDIPVADIGADERISIGFQSSTFCLDGESNAVGAGIDKIEVRRRREESEHARNSLLVTRFPGGKHWIKEDAFLYGELLHPAGELRQLCFVGGEPLVVNETARVIEYLAEKGEPEKCILNFTTNGTIFDERLLRTSALFKQVVVVVSLDGVDGLLEYIRYPANWTTVKSNLKRFAGLDNVILRISATFQAYNALNFVPLLRFCDEEGYEILFNVLCFPEYLAATVLPPSARLLAAERLRKYIETADTRQNVQQILSLANMLEGAGDAVDRDMLRKFMEFTNDLDKSRGQVLEDVAPEIKDCMREDGVPWSTKTVYA